MIDSIKIVDKGQDIAFVEFDLLNEKVNKLSHHIMLRLKEIVIELNESKYKVAVFISKKKDIFIAGADIDEIKKIKTKEDFNKVLVEAHEIINSIEDTKLITIAAINGACMGGGCELSLACDYRIITDNNKSLMGLPEVKLGIIPGFGGCIRLPRVIGLQAALDIILAGKSVRAQKAKKIGLVDQIVSLEQLERAAIDMALKVISKGKRAKVFKAKGIANKALESALGRLVVFSKAKEQVLKMTKGFYPAPLRAIQVIKRTYGYSNREKAIEEEISGFCDVAVTEESKNLINVFYLMEGNKQIPGLSSEVIPKDVQSVAVLGAGVMGGGIAQVLADKGIFVKMKDISNEAIAIGLKQAQSIWLKKVKRKRLDSFGLQQKMDLLSGGLTYDGLKNKDLVIEAIVEDMSIKKTVITEAASHLSEQCLFATNTSSLSVTEMAKAFPRPELFVGMHFFNPVHKMPLVEVIRGEKTSDQTTATIFALAKKMGKFPVVVKDGPGFLVNRLLFPYMSEALFLLEEGMDVVRIDKIFTDQFGMPMGPFRLLDEVGLDVGIKVLKVFKEAFGERVQVSPLADKLALTDRLGKKNQKGFYLYDSKGIVKEFDSRIYPELGLQPPNNPHDDQHCIQRLIYLMINEAVLSLSNDRIVERPEDVDLAMIMGTGFPPFRGGLLRYADKEGIKSIVEVLDLFATQYGGRFSPSNPLAQLAISDKGIYSN